MAGASVPIFTLGLLALFFLYYKLGWFPAGGQTSPGSVSVSGPTGFLSLDALLTGNVDVFLEVLWHLVLPAIALALTPALLTARTLRSSLRHSLRQDYVRTARAKGSEPTAGALASRPPQLPERPVDHPGLELGAMLAGIAIVETIFAWPGIGLYIDRSIASAHAPAIAGVTLVTGFVFVVANAMVDVLQMMVDPRLNSSWPSGRMLSGLALGWCNGTRRGRRQRRGDADQRLAAGPEGDRPPARRPRPACRTGPLGRLGSLSLMRAKVLPPAPP